MVEQMGCPEMALSLGRWSKNSRGIIIAPEKAIFQGNNEWGEIMALSEGIGNRSGQTG
jgi:hypothetical protein